MFYIYKRLEKIHSIGVINYLPSSIKDFFLAQSVFDVLCNIWFVPKLSLYVKRFALPFFVNMSREDAYSLIYELDPGLALKLDTKGVINILPEKVSKAILPKNKNFDKKVKFQEKNKEVINLIKYNENQAILVKPKTELIGSGSRRQKKNKSILDTQINHITKKIPTLEPVFSKILGNHFRKLMSSLSHKVLGVTSMLAGTCILVQLLYSKYARN